MILKNLRRDPSQERSIGSFRLPFTIGQFHDWHIGRSSGILIDCICFALLQLQLRLLRHIPKYILPVCINMVIYCFFFIYWFLTSALWASYADECSSYICTLWVIPVLYWFFWRINVYVKSLFSNMQELWYWQRKSNKEIHNSETNFSIFFFVNPSNYYFYSKMHIRILLPTNTTAKPETKKTKNMLSPFTLFFHGVEILQQAWQLKEIIECDRKK